ncbi:MAG: C39 family peptidase [Patescibacteria group bacterium]|nr:C39 family peptidase [Patescibacteria group bacterium]
MHSRSFWAFLVLISLLLPLSGKNIAVADNATTTAGGATPSASTSTLQAQIDANNQQIAALNQQIADYQAKLLQIGADKKTLQAAIKSLDLKRSKIQTQVAITQKQINTTQLQIQELGGRIEDTQQSIASNQVALGAYLRNLQKADGRTVLMQVLGSNTLSDIWTDVNATLEMQSAVEDQMSSLKTQQTTLAASRTASQQKQQMLTAQQQTLASQQVSLTTTEQQKTQLLAQTKAKESNYQKLLAAAEAELQSFTAFTQNAGGSKLLGSQTVCDNWGCYYNQRDAAWGNNSLNGTRYTLASDGCLITSLAMVMTHYGYRDVTPATINSNPDNFASYYPAYLLYTINVDGVSATRTAAAIDATLATGNPVIVGVHAYGGTHYVVLVSGKRGNYLMRDPYIANGDNVAFADHYSVNKIFGITKVVINNS